MCKSLRVYAKYWLLAPGLCNLSLDPRISAAAGGMWEFSIASWIQSFLSEKCAMLEKSGVDF